MRRTLLRSLVAAAAVAAILVPAIATAHEERPSRFPSGRGSVPQYRTSGPALVVCRADSAARIRGLPAGLRAHNERLLQECRFHDIQAAVDAVRERGTRILILPGVYLEKPSLEPTTGECGDLPDDRPLTYEEQVRCPHVQNLIAIFGDGPDEGIACDGRLCDLQIEGTGARPEDVIVDGAFHRLNVIRADRADGIYFRNFTVQHALFNAVYVIETDGFVIDRMVGRWTDEYGFLTFAVDHGLYVDCEAYGNGDSGLYPGSASDLHGVRPSVEITRCRSHHNAIGYSGTAGNSTYVHDNEFFANATGATMDSFFPNHPGLPQDAATFVNNRIYGNNVNYYRYWAEGTCDRPSAKRGYEEGVVCPTIPVPVGTGIMVAGGNDNLFAENWIYNNWRFGTMQFWVPSFFREEYDPAKQYDTSHFNRYVGNFMGVSPSGEALPNGTDFWWDEEGAGNCWQDNLSGDGEITSDPFLLPTCDQPPFHRPGNMVKLATLAPCGTWSVENHHPEGCDWMQRPRPPE